MSYYYDEPPTWFTLVIGLLLILVGTTIIVTCEKETDKKRKLENCLEMRLNETTNEYQCLKPCKTKVLVNNEWTCKE